MSEDYNKTRKNQSSASRCAVCNTANASESTAAAADAVSEAAASAERRAEDFSSPVCISTNQIYDSCRDRDCVSDSRVYLTADGQALIQNAINVKLKKAEIIWVYSNVEPLSFNAGYFSVDLKFFVCVTLEVFTGVSCPTTICGLSTFDKRVILYGSEGNTKVFKSSTSGCAACTGLKSTAMPEVVVETVEPVALNAAIADPCEKECCGCKCECDTSSSTANGLFPEFICGCFDSPLITDNSGKQVLVSYGLFSIVRLERDSQLMLDAVDFCIPSQECPSATEDNPCELFDGIRFPINEFFPPQKRNDSSCNGCSSCGCNC